MRASRTGSAAVAALVLAGVALGAAPAYAAEGSIDHYEDRGSTVKILYSVPGADVNPDLGSVKVTLDGKPLTAKAVSASDGAAEVRRTAILAIDVSGSMKGAKFEAAQQAADLFLDTAPDDLYVGVVTFAAGVSVAQKPTLDHDAAKSAIGDLSLSNGTQLYDGIEEAVAQSGKNGQRSVLVLSDGRDTSDTKLSTVTTDLQASGVKVDVVALAQSASDEARLSPLAAAGKGTVVSAADGDALRKAFATEAQALAHQILVTVDRTGSQAVEGTLAVSVDADGTTYDDSAFVSLAATASISDTRKFPHQLQAADTSTSVTRNLMLGGLGALGVGLLVLIGMIIGVGKRKSSPVDRIDDYTRQAMVRQTSRSRSHEQTGVAAQAVGIAEKALSGGGLEGKLADKLETAGMSLKPAEWLLLHAGIAIGGTGLVFLITSMDPLFTGLAVLLGVLGPWIYLGRKQKGRLRAFDSQLAPTLQLLAGSLQAGLSLSQGMDTIVREGAEPMSVEFRRALVETRLGVPIEDALDSMATRMMSDDFAWTVMAIRIQREVGGNLAELLLNVAGTMRERDYLRRQVKSLSAEGRFSAYILLALPPLILIYEWVSNRSYLRPLYTEPVGWVMLAGMGMLMGLGAFMMSRMIKLEV